MLDLKSVSFLILSLIVSHIECQGLFSGISGRQNPIDRLPGVGACDRIASRGVGNCMENFLPTNVLSSFTGGPRGGSNGDVCCSYSKYRACISGLNAGLRVAMEREKCPRSYSTNIISSLGDSMVGSPLKQFCNSGGGGTKCPKPPSTKPKKNQKPKKRPENSYDGDLLGIGGQGGRGGDGGGLLDRSLGGLGGLGTSRSLEGIGNPFGGLGGPGGLGGGSFNPLDPLNIFGQRNNGRGGGQDGGLLGPVRGIIDKSRETFHQGTSTIVGGLQTVLGGLGGGGGLGNLGGLGGGRGGSRGNGRDDDY